MPTELRPLGVTCNIQCHYCYQNAQREAGNMGGNYDISKMLQTVDQVGMEFTLFGGEPLLLPLEDLERIWAWGKECFGKNSVQTNGTLITKEHIDLFKKYNVTVGISIDGDGELNDVRWCGNLEKTRTATSKTMSNIELLCESGIYPGIIVTLHRFNASKSRLPRLLLWLECLDELELKSCRVHLLEVETPMQRQLLALTADENIQSLLELYRLERELHHLKFDIFQEMRALLLGLDNKTTCIWNACDPMTTRAVQGVEGDGTMSNCGRVNKDGVDFSKASEQGYERYIGLYYASQEKNGCNGCRFFLMCKGQCPGTAIDNDWRNRSEQCSIWMRLFEEIESDLITQGYNPLSQHAVRAILERYLVQEWTKGANPNLLRLFLHSSATSYEREVMHAYLVENNISHKWSQGKLAHLDHHWDGE